MRCGRACVPPVDFSMLSLTTISSFPCSLTSTTAWSFATAPMSSTTAVYHHHPCSCGQPVAAIGSVICRLNLRLQFLHLRRIAYRFQQHVSDISQCFRFCSCLQAVPPILALAASTVVMALQPPRYGLGVPAEPRPAVPPQQ